MSTVKERQRQEAARIAKYDNSLAYHKMKSKEDKPKESLMEYLEPYSDYFIDNGYSYKFKTKSSNVDKQLVELTRHVFAKYRVPKHLQDVWSDKIPEKRRQGADPYPLRRRQPEPLQKTINDDLVLWYLCVAQGGSLYKEHAKKYLTKKEVHVFLNHPHDLTFAESLIFATAMTFAPNDGVALRLAKSKLNQKMFDDFVKNAVYFFAKNTPVSVEEVNDLTDFLYARRFARVNGRPVFTLVGSTLDSVRRKCVDWHYELRRTKDMGNHQWEGCLLPDEVIVTKGDNGNKVYWNFVQIRNSKDLAAEGTQMRHCVYGYRVACMRNETYIWSLARQDWEGATPTKKVTIELHNNGRIVQARGKANRSMRNDERNAVSRWAQKNGLRLTC